MTIKEYNQVAKIIEDVLMDNQVDYSVANKILESIAKVVLFGKKSKKNKIVIDEKTFNK